MNEEFKPDFFQAEENLRRMERRVGEFREVILRGGKKAQEAESTLYREFGDVVKGALRELVQERKRRQKTFRIK